MRNNNQICYVIVHLCFKLICVSNLTEDCNYLCQWIVEIRKIHFWLYKNNVACKVQKLSLFLSSDRESLPMPHPSPDNKVWGANIGPTWVLSAPDGPHIGPMNLAIREGMEPIFPVTSLPVSSCICQCLHDGCMPCIWNELIWEFHNC